MAAFLAIVRRFAAWIVAAVLVIVVIILLIVLLAGCGAHHNNTSTTTSSTSTTPSTATSTVPTSTVSTPSTNPSTTPTSTVSTPTTTVAPSTTPSTTTGSTASGASLTPAATPTSTTPLTAETGSTAVNVAAKVCGDQSAGDSGLVSKFDWGSGPVLSDGGTIPVTFWICRYGDPTTPTASSWMAVGTSDNDTLSANYAIIQYPASLTVRGGNWFQVPETLAVGQAWWFKGQLTVPPSGGAVQLCLTPIYQGYATDPSHDKQGNVAYNWQDIGTQSAGCKNYSR
jgi:cytoskeletal protein RodZ